MKYSLKLSYVNSDDNNSISFNPFSNRMIHLHKVNECLECQQCFELKLYTQNNTNNNRNYTIRLINTDDNLLTNGNEHDILTTIIEKNYKNSIKKLNSKKTILTTSNKNLNTNYITHNKINNNQLESEHKLFNESNKYFTNLNSNLDINNNTQSSHNALEEINHIEKAKGSYLSTYKPIDQYEPELQSPNFKIINTDNIQKINEINEKIFINQIPIDTQTTNNHIDRIKELYNTRKSCLSYKEMSIDSLKLCSVNYLMTESDVECSSNSFKSSVESVKHVKKINKKIRNHSEGIKHTRIANDEIFNTKISLDYEQNKSYVIMVLSNAYENVRVIVIILY